MRTFTFLLPLLAAVLPPGLFASPSGWIRKFPKPPRPYKIDLSREKPDQVVLKFVEGSGVRLRGGRFVSFAGRDTKAVNLLIQSLGVQVERYFTRSEEDLDQERAHILANLGPDEEIPAELNLYYLVRTSGVTQSEETIDGLNALPIVEFAYAEVADSAYVPCGDIPPPTPDFTSRQTYFGPSPSGVNYRAAYVLGGGRAQGRTIAHIEGSWTVGHEDLALMTSAAYVSGPPTSNFTSSSWKEHGTACVGIMAADRNGYGVNGFASGRKKLLLACIGYGAARQINNCAGLSGPGDVFSSSFAYVISGKHAPLTYVRANYDAVRNATAKGITYAFAAGNSNMDLMNSIYHGYFDPSKYDSGGVIVGASKTNGIDKISFSNYGKRVDCHAWGTGITTFGYGVLFSGGGDHRQYYTYRFGGTSGATPIVAGIAAVFWNAVKEQNGVSLKSSEVRDALRKYGTPQRYGGHIGPQPDLEKMLAAYGLPDGLWLQKDVKLGGKAVLEITGKPNGMYVLLMSIAPAHLSLPGILNRDILVDLKVGAGVASGPLDTQGKASLSFTVPTEPTLAEKDFYFQVVDFTSTGKIHASNSIELYLAK